MVNDFLFELGCEELPSASVWPLADSLKKQLQVFFNQAKLTYKTIDCFATSRRLAILVKDLQASQAPQVIVRKGPSLTAAYNKDGEPTPALLGFARSCNVPVSQLTSTTTDKGDWVIFQSETEGVPTRDLLANFICQALHALPIAKPMRWGDQTFLFARPVHWTVLLWGNELIQAKILGTQTNRYTYGHRFHHPQAIELTEPREYELQLKEAFVIANFQNRRALIEKQILEIAAQNEAEVIIPSSLLDEVTSIVEWPKALLANFLPEFLQVPSEVIIASMQSHQKCFALRNKKGNLLPAFIAVSNLESKDPKQIILGNEKVMRARLQDAAFFYNQDKKRSLNQFVIETKKVTFQHGLGSLYEKSQRIQILMLQLSNTFNLTANQVQRAAELCKFDLMTGLVGEFPELQGLMGYYYAKESGESHEVAVALNEQYYPRFAGDELPSTALGLALSLTDRIDTLTGIFMLGHKPSGDKDPFKLRRHALAIARLLIQSSDPLNLSTLIKESIQLYAPLNLSSPKDKKSDQCFIVKEDETQIEKLIHYFILERLQSYYLSKGMTGDLCHAVLARQDDWLYDLDKRMDALTEFKQLAEAKILSASCKRVDHLLEQTQYDLTKLAPLQKELFTDDAEKNLFLSLMQVQQAIEPFYLKNDYKTVLQKLATLHQVINEFFDKVMVMVDDEAIKINRLQLLLELQMVLKSVANISLLQL